MNSWSIIGRLGRDAQSRALPSGDEICEFSVALNHGWGDRQRTNWVRAKLWGRLATSGIVPFLKTGLQVGLVGNLELVEWELESENKSLLVLNVKQIDLLGGGQNQNGATKKVEPAQKVPFDSDDTYDDIPF
jgi:single-strand DNA-binding protein